MAIRHLVVDGSNIATEGRSKPSLKQLDEAVRAFLAEHPHDRLTVVVDATFEHRIDRGEKKLYDEAVSAGELITPPAGTVGRGDKFLLEVADKANATVLSNDSFQEFHGDYRWLFDDGRLWGGKPVPDVGWVFTIRAPVRGPRSRQAVRAATNEGKAKKVAKTTKASKPAKRRGKRAAQAAEVATTRPAGRPDQGAGPGRRRRGRGRGRPQEPVNEALPFLEFVTEHPVGTRVDGIVDSFSSHGAYVHVGDVRCYVPLAGLGEPPPRSAREVLNRGETRSFVVQALDAPRRGVDLALPGFERIEPSLLQVEGVQTAEADKSPVDAGEEPTERGGMAVKRAAKKKAPAKRKAPARKAPAKRKSPAKRKAPAKRKSTTKRAPAKRKATAKKASKRRAPARKKKSAARKTAARKTASRKTAARKRPAAKKAARRTTKRTTKR